MSTLSLLCSDASSIMNSPQYMRLSDLVDNLEEKQKNNIPISPKKMSMLQIATEQFIDVLDKENDTQILPSLRRSLHLLASGTPLKHISMLVGENEELKQEVSDLKERNSILVQLSEGSMKTFQSANSSIDMMQKIDSQKSEIKKYTKTIHDLQEQNELLALQCQKFQKKYENKKKKVEKLEDALYDYDENIAGLKQKIEDIKSQTKIEENDNKLQLISEENSALKESNEKMLEFFNEQKRELEKQSLNYQQVCEQRDSLKRTVDKLMETMEYLQQDNVNESKSKTLPIVPLVDDSSFDMILESLISTSDDKDIIKILRESNVDIEDRIINAFKELSSRNNENVKQNESNETPLKAIAYSQLMFLHHLINNKEMQKLIIAIPQSDHLKKYLIQVYQEEKKYIKDNKIELNEDDSIFNYLLPLSNKEITKEKMLSFIDEIQVSTDKKAFQFVIQCALANEILIKYSENLKLIIKSNSKDLNKFKNEKDFLSSNNKQLKERIETLEKENEVVKVAITRCLKNAKKNKQNESIVAICSSVLSNDIKIPDREVYILKLEKKIKTQKKKFSDAVERYEKLIGDLKDKNNDLESNKSELEEKINAFEAEKKEFVSEKQNQIANNLKEIKSLNKTIQALNDKMKEDKYEYKNELDSLKDSMSILRSNCKAIIVDIKEKLSIIREVFNSSNKSIGHQLKKYIVTIGNIKQNSKNYLIPCFETLIKDNRKLKDRENSYKSALSDDEKKYADIQEELQKAKESNALLSANLSKANYKLKITEEKAKRELLLLKKQNEFLNQVKENEKLQILEKYKEEKETFERTILSKLSSSLSNFVDLSIPLSSQSIDSMISRIKTKISKIMKDNQLKVEYEEQNRTIGTLLSCKESSNVACEFEKYFRETQSKLQSLEQEISTIKYSNDYESELWKEWAKDMIVSIYGSNEIPNNEEKQRKVLSDIIMTSISVGSATRKIEMLRDEISINKNGIIGKQTKKGDEIHLKSVIKSIQALVFIQKLSGCIQNRMTKGVDASKIQSNPALFKNFIVN